MDLQTILGLIARHALTTIAGTLVAHGYLASSGTEQFIGAGMVFLGIAWSWWQKVGQKEAMELLARAKTSPATKAVIAFLIVSFALSFAFQAFAQPKTAAAAPVGKLTAAQAQANPLAILQKLPITDLQAALADAQANNDATTIPCWQALLDAAQAQQAAPTVPAGIFSAIQKARDLKVAAANALSPTGPLAKLNIACAPLLMDVNNTLLMLGVSTGLVVGTGGISLPALPGLLPLLLAPKL